MRISVIDPVMNEAPWIGYSIMSALPYVHEFVYALDEGTNDGTRELLDFIKHRHAFEKLKVIDFPHFHPSDAKAYNASFNECIARSTGDACWFYHPDMVVTRWHNPEEGPLAWWTHVESFAGNLQTRILKGRCHKWKNLHAKQYGLHYAGGYGSQNEDFYHSVITGNAHKHYGMDFDQYPFDVADSGIYVNHYCELKNYSRRLEKMKLCLKTQNPAMTDELIRDIAARHQRVTLEETGSDGTRYEYESSLEPVPEVITKYKDEFASFIKEPIHG